MTPRIPKEVYDKIVQLCKKHKVRELSLFGSRVRGDFTEKSDFDFLVDFLPDARIGLFEFARMQIDLEELMRTKVDLVPKDGLKPRIRDRVLAEAMIVYAG